MSWLLYLAIILLFTFALAVIYALLVALIFGLQENYRRYWQRAELQWTGSETRALKQRPLPMNKIIIVALISALILTQILF